MFTFSRRTRLLLLSISLLGLVGPNGLFIYSYFTDPPLMGQALGNPISLAFLIESFFLLLLFLGFTWRTTRSVPQVILFLGLSLLGSLAFSFPLFLYLKSDGHSDAKVETNPEV